MPLERLNGEIKRRTEVVSIFANEEAITRLVDAILLEQNDEWAVQRARYMKCAIAHCGRCQFGPPFLCKDGPWSTMIACAAPLRTGV